MEVEEWAREHASSSEEETFPPDSADESVRPEEAAGLELFVTSGPWNSLHTPSRACEESYWTEQQDPRGLPPQAEACCGVKLGMFATFVQSDAPEAVCMRRACVKAREARLNRTA